jgi:tetratricopeptide (TPR) repeat protein
MKRTLTALALALTVSAGFPVALAAGGGGGGGGGWGSSPSTDAPRIDPVARYREGVQYLEARDFKKAERAFRDVVGVARTDANSRYMLGLAHAGQEEWKDARKAFTKAIELKADLIDARLRLALVSLKLEDRAAAEGQRDALQAQADACAQTCAQAAELASALQTLNDVLAAPADTVQSSALPAPVLADWTEGDAAYLDAVAHINLADYDTALARLDRAALAFGPHPDVLTYIGFANRKSGRYEAALASYAAALAINPDHVGANEYLGEYHVERGDLDAARLQLARVEAVCAFGCPEAEELRGWIARAR